MLFGKIKKEKEENEENYKKREKKKKNLFSKTRLHEKSDFDSF